MARPSKFDRLDILAATAALAATEGPGAVTMASVAARLGAPTGSIYHRFGSREDLMAETWLSATESFQAGFLAALARPSQPPGLEAALHAIRWARDQPTSSRIVVLYRRQDFVAMPLPPPLRSRAERLAADLDRALTGFAAAAMGSSDLVARQRAAFLLLDIPYAAIRRYLSAGMEPPPSIEDLVRGAFQALALPPD
jgi:AcrR family transcriptional regulator